MGLFNESLFNSKNSLEPISKEKNSRLFVAKRGIVMNFSVAEVKSNQIYKPKTNQLQIKD